MARWQNWSGRQVSKNVDLHFVRSTEDAVGVVRRAAQSGRTVRAAGAGHSHAPVAVNNEVIVDTSGLAGVIDVDTQAAQAWIRAGSPVYSLGAPLHAHGLALKNQGDIDRQFIAGAISTGTHGTGRALQNLSASVVALRLIVASGETVTCSLETEPELFRAARLGFGSVGLITEVLMQLRSSCVLREAGWQSGLDELMEALPDHTKTYERFEFFWYPATDRAQVKTIEASSDTPVYPLAEEGARQAWSFEVLPSHRPHFHTEMEYSIPEEHGPRCLAAIRDLLRNDFPDVVWPVEYRTVAQDDIWLSMAEGRPTVTISVHQDINQDETHYYRACEEIFLQYEGRPHWGKVNYLSGDQFAERYHHWADWWRVRDIHDPNGTFLNPWAASIRP